MRGDIAGKQGRRDVMGGELDEARALRAPRGSRTKVAGSSRRVDTRCARSPESARELGGEALEARPEEVGPDGLRAHALNTVGTSRRRPGGDTGGRRPRESSIALPRDQCHSRPPRGRNNPGPCGWPSCG
jgi:hypothetical protein